MTRDATAGTPAYAAVVSKCSKSVDFGVFDPGQTRLISDADIHRSEAHIAESSMLLMDGNIPVGAINAACELARPHNIPIWFDPADSRYTPKIFQSFLHRDFTYFSPNWAEFVEYLRHKELALPPPPAGENLTDYYLYLLTNCQDIFRHSLGAQQKGLILTLGKEGVITVHRDKVSTEYFISLYPAPTLTGQIVNSSGAGDCFNAGVIHGLLRNEEWNTCLGWGFHCVKECLSVWETVPETLNSLTQMTSKTTCVPTVSLKLK
jgi:sugar/nucleoside kinase (ribokinase family)